MQIAAELGIPCVEKDMALFDVYNAQEAFLTGTAAEVVAMTKLDNRVIGDGKPGPVTARIRQRFQEITHNEGTPCW